MARKCDGCTLCCTALTVPELGKPNNVKCEHCDNGCKIYATRPASCSAFACGWLREELPAWAKPDKVHFFIERLSNHMVLAVPAMGHEHTWLTHDVNNLLIDAYQKKGTAVVSLTNCRALIPDNHTADEVGAAFAYILEQQTKRLTKNDNSRLQH